jgi:hypothetical protein
MDSAKPGVENVGWRNRKQLLLFFLVEQKLILFLFSSSISQMTA